MVSSSSSPRYHPPPPGLGSLLVGDSPRVLRRAVVNRSGGIGIGVDGSGCGCGALPGDVLLLVVSFLDAVDVCSLGSCSRYYRDLCGSDWVWASLFRRRWPSSDVCGSGEGGNSRVVQGWKKIYISRQEEIISKLSDVIDFVKHSTSDNGSLEIGDYLKAVGDLASIGIGFQDVKCLLFQTKCTVLLNLIGLQHSIVCLRILVNDLKKVLESCKISERQVCVHWKRRGDWVIFFRRSDERVSRRISLSGLMSPKNEEVREVLEEGVTESILQAHITSVDTSGSWSLTSLK